MFVFIIYAFINLKFAVCVGEVGYNSTIQTTYWTTYNIFYL